MAEVDSPMMKGSSGVAVSVGRPADGVSRRGPLVGVVDRLEPVAARG